VEASACCLGDRQASAPLAGAWMEIARKQKGVFRAPLPDWLLSKRVCQLQGCLNVAGAGAGQRRQVADAGRPARLCPVVSRQYGPGPKAPELAPFAAPACRAGCSQASLPFVGSGTAATPAPVTQEPVARFGLRRRFCRS